MQWRVGQRVSRKDSDERGTVIEVDKEIKIKWDRGRTSYFRRDAAANMRALNDADAVDDVMDLIVEEGARPDTSKQD